MVQNELRALADALEPMAAAPRFDGLNVPAFCAWLRACADAQPIGYATANGLRMLKQDDATVLLYKHDYLIRPDHVPLYMHPAPAAPQAEPIDPHMIVAEDRFPDEQAEPSEFKFQPRAGALARSWDRADALAEPKEEKNVWKQIIPDDAPQAEPSLGELMREQRRSRIVAGAYPDGNPNAVAMMAQTPQAEPKREPVGTLTIRDDMGAEITFHRSFTMRPRQTFAIYPNWDLLTHDIPTRGAFVVNAPKEIGNEFLPFHPAPAAPQAEPCIGNDPACPCQDGDACHYKDGADGTKAWSVPQAEPKREPLSEELKCCAAMRKGGRHGNPIND